MQILEKCCGEFPVLAKMMCLTEDDHPMRRQVADDLGGEFDVRECDSVSLDNDRELGLVHVGTGRATTQQTE
jgi:hypothetical protein